MRFTIPAGCLLVLLVAADVHAAQSLADLARQEEDRRKAVQTPARVITDKDLHPGPGPSADAPPDPIAPATPSGAIDEGARTVVRAARYRAGGLPEVPVQAVSGGEVLLEVTVSREGRVVAAKVLRHTPPFTDALTAAVGSWQFRPAVDEATPKPGEPIDPKTRRPVESKVLVGAMFRPPGLYAITLGEPPKDVAAPSEEIPFPLGPATMPLYPPLALSDGVVLAELHVGAEGGLTQATVIRSSPAFDDAALDAVRQWPLRPARIRGRSVETLAYVVLAFRSPVTGAPAAGPAPSGPR